MTLTALIDVDGTLVDSNYQHSVGWARAFADCDLTVPLRRIHEHIGMGGDQLVEAVAGEDAERQHGDRIRDREGAHFEELIGEVRAFEGASEFLEALVERGLSVVLSSSAPEDEISHYVDLLDAEGLITGYTTADDVERTKPHPDVLESALRLGTGEPAGLLGDTVWDMKAAGRADIPAIAVLSGGICESDLRDAGARFVDESVLELTQQLDKTPFNGA